MCHPDLTMLLICLKRMNYFGGYYWHLSHVSSTWITKWIEQLCTVLLWGPQWPVNCPSLGHHWARRRSFVLKQQKSSIENLEGFQTSWWTLTFKKNNFDSLWKTFLYLPSPPPPFSQQVAILLFTLPRLIRRTFVQEEFSRGRAGNE